MDVSLKGFIANELIGEVSFSCGKTREAGAIIEKAQSLIELGADTVTIEFPQLDFGV